MSEFDDRQLAELYRASAREMPPTAIDRRLILAASAAARQPSLASRWAMPMAAAAVIVLATSLVLVVQDHQAEQDLNSRADVAPQPVPARQAPPDPASPQINEAQRTESEQRRATPPRVAQGRPPDMVKRALESEEPPRADPAAKEVLGASVVPSEPPAAAKAMIGKPPSPASNAPDSTGPIRRPSTDALKLEREEAVRDTRAREAASAPQPAASAPAAPASVPVPRRQDQAAPVASPEQWLERLQKLRAAGQEAEVQAGLAEFRRQYPDYPIPELLK